MGVRLLVGTYDGTGDAAAMVDSASGWMIGPVWESSDATEQIEAFLGWLRSGAWASHVTEIFGDAETQRAAHRGRELLSAGDPREWTDNGLEKLIVWWRRENIGDDGWMLDPFECSCGTGHVHLGDDGEEARHGECPQPGCSCTTWQPGNKAAARAAEGA